jgi:hypothetical protein
MLILGTSAASLISGFLTKSVEELGKKAVGAAWDKAQELFHFVKRGLSGDPAGQAAIDKLEAAPNDSKAKEEAAACIAEAATKDTSFAKELSSKLAAAAQSGVDNVFNTNVAGDIEKFIQIQTMYGNITM